MEKRQALVRLGNKSGILLRWIAKLKDELSVKDEIEFMGGSSFQPVIHDWCNTGRGMCNPVNRKE